MWDSPKLIEIHVHLEKPGQWKQAHYLDKPISPCRVSMTTEDVDLFFSFFFKAK